MRSIWLASAAVILSAGIACAQTSTGSPAPTGAPNAPTETPPGSSASPGNTGTGNNSAGMSGPASPASGSGAMSGSGTSSPAPTGAPQAAQESPNPSAPPGNMAPSGSAPVAGGAASSSNAASAPQSSATDTSTMASAKPVHHRYGGAALPDNASADRYLHIAADAIKHHNRGVADDALSHAETRILTRAVPAGGIAADDSPRISAIEGARKALSSGDYQTAADDTRQASHGHMDGGMGQMGGQTDSMGQTGGGMSGPDTSTPMPGTPISGDSASGSSAGNGK